WIKNREITENHFIASSVQDTDGHKYLYTNLTSMEGDRADGVTSIDSDGFSLGAWGNNNTNNDTHVSWLWKAGTANSGSTSGSGTAKAYSSSTNAAAGFSIIKYVGNGTSGMEIPHHMGVAPQCLIAKNLDRGSGAGSDWHVWHTGFGTQDKYIWLNEANPAYASTNYFKAVSSTTFTLGTDVGLNVNDEDFICYAFTGIEGYSKVGSYTGNGATDGPFIYTGFRPAWYMIRRVDSAPPTGWMIEDNKRLGYNVANRDLIANLNVNEQPDDRTDMLSNGFKIRATSNNFNNSGGTYIYLAFAESPFKTSNAR
ncbi:MAG: hypothetical protein QF535_01440, partial [Anaerolineales bacterium]|nr:hypothetical protein [Anaerolineales bacterium]